MESGTAFDLTHTPRPVSSPFLHLVDKPRGSSVQPCPHSEKVTVAVVVTVMVEWWPPKSYVHGLVLEIWEM